RSPRLHPRSDLESRGDRGDADRGHRLRADLRHAAASLRDGPRSVGARGAARFRGRVAAPTAPLTGRHNAGAMSRSPADVAALAPCVCQLLTYDDHRRVLILVTGVKGSIKTATIRELARRIATGGSSVLLAAGDTFRGAEIKRLKI